MNAVMSVRVPQYAGKFLSSCATDGFSRRAHLHEASRLVSLVCTVGSGFLLLLLLLLFLHLV
jgi:hypothetical protein